MLIRSRETHRHVARGEQSVDVVDVRSQPRLGVQVEKRTLPQPGGVAVDIEQVVEARTVLEIARQAAARDPLVVLGGEHVERDAPLLGERGACAPPVTGQFGLGEDLCEVGGRGSLLSANAASGQKQDRRQHEPLKSHRRIFPRNAPGTTREPRPATRSTSIGPYPEPLLDWSDDARRVMQVNLGSAA